MLNDLIIEQMAKENRQLTNRAETAEMDARIAEEQIGILAQQLADAQAERDAYRENGLQNYGLLLSIKEWLRGDLPEVSAVQFIILIDQATAKLPIPTGGGS